MNRTTCASARRARVLSTFAAVVLLNLVGCSGGQSASEPTAGPATTGAAPSPTSTPATAPPATPPTTTAAQAFDALNPLVDTAQRTPEQTAILRGYVEARKATVRAKMAPVNTQHPDVLLAFTGLALKNLQESLQDRQTKRKALRPPTNFRIAPAFIRTFGSKTAEVRSCDTSDEASYDLTSAATLTSGIFSIRMTAFLRETQDGRWVVYEQEVGESFEGSATCPPQ